MDIDKIREGLRKPGKTQRGLATRLGLDPAAVNRLLKGERQLKATELPIVKEYLELPLDAVPPNAKIDGGGHRRPSATDIPSPGEMPQDLPVLGSGASGEDGVFELNGQIVQYVRRPPKLRGTPDAYAIYVAGDSMSPWREEGDLVYVHPHQPAKIGDYVVVQLVPARAGQAPEAYIKRLVKRTASEVRLLQYSPRKELTVPARRVQSIHRIIDWSELMAL